MGLKITNDERGVYSGGVMTEKQKEALRKISVKPDDSFFDNLDLMNEELEEEKVVPEVKTLPKRPQFVAKERERVPDRRPAARQLREQAEEIREESRPRSRVEIKEEAVMERMGEESLDDALGMIASEANSLGTQDAPQEDLAEQLVSTFKKIPNAPSDAQIAKWKGMHGEKGVYVITFSDTEAYVFTHLTRDMWGKVQETMNDLGNKSGMEARQLEEKLKEKVVQYCVLWPKPLPTEFFYTSRAGVIPSVYEAITLNSYFLSPSQTMMLTTTL